MAATKPCANCGKDIPGDSRFCPACGVAQALSCAACGHVNGAGSRFCAQCGSKLGEAAAAAPAAAQAPVTHRNARSSARRRIWRPGCNRPQRLIHRRFRSTGFASRKSDARRTELKRRQETGKCT
ncbi:MAG: zinc ribbon domain-containing protein [Hyphomicrobiales bacterium]|nr:zinc ribbon domain-containing protein [Hyphomicrobiales bacterium]MDE2282987.1 zinc ribbon domain-containing protein [Hyphomicrobiales bacterium]